MRKANIIAGSILVVLAAYVMYAATLLPVKITGSGLGGYCPLVFGWDAGTLGVNNDH